MAQEGDVLLWAAALAFSPCRRAGGAARWALSGRKRLERCPASSWELGSLSQPSEMPFFWLPQSDDLRNLSLSGHVGFDSLPDQLVNKSTSQGFCFNILCVGESCHRAGRSARTKGCPCIPQLAPSPSCPSDGWDHRGREVMVSSQSCSRVKSGFLLSLLSALSPE